MHNHNFTHEEAVQFIDRLERERVAFRRAINQNDLSEEFFDLVINRASFSDTEIVDIILHAAEKKDLFLKLKHKIEFY